MGILEMKKVNILIFFLLYCFCTNAQWFVQQVPTTNVLIDIYFADSSQGWVTGRDGIFHTSDGGNTWGLQYQGITGALSGLNNSELWATSLRDTLLHTTNGGISWDIITINNFTGFDSTWSLSTIYFFDTNIGWTQARGWISGSMEYPRLLKTTDRGATWEMSTPPYLSFDAFIQFFDSLYGYRTGSGLHFYRTTDGGETWEQLGWYSLNYTLCMQMLTKDIGWTTTDGPVLSTAVWKTIDGGENWYINNSFECSDLTTYLSFTDTLNGWVVQWTCISGGTEIWHTSDGGTTWNLQFTTLPPLYFSPRQIIFVDSLHGWVVGENGVILHTSNGGVIPVELTSFTAKVIDEGVILEWATATETNNSGFEILRFTQNDNEWKTIGFVPGYGTTTEPKSYSFVDENVTTGTYKYRLKQIDFDGTYNYSEVIEVEVDFTPKEFALYQNYPNPFNPATIIKYDLPNISDVSLIIYDILGRKVKELVNAKQQAGRYEIQFNASSLSSGVYIYQLVADKYISSKKMILLK